MAYLNDFFRLLALLFLLLGSVQPIAISTWQNLIQSIDYSQFSTIQAWQSSIDLAAYLQSDAVAHPLAIVTSVLGALYLNKHVQICLYQIHLLVYEYNPFQTLSIVLENIWNFCYCLGSPVAIAKVTHYLSVSFLTRFCAISDMYIDITAEVFGLCLLLQTFAITEQYVEYRTFEIELMAIPPNLNPNNYGSTTSSSSPLTGNSRNRTPSIR